MPRYFAELAYKGTGFSGWQNQPGQVSVQSAIEEALSTILRKPIAVIGCGRTDTGVHAHQYFLHFDMEETLPDFLLSRLNKVVGDNIVFYRIFPVEEQYHARYSAVSRSYEYRLELRKNPFSTQTAFYYPQADRLDFSLMQKSADLILSYDAFFPFCKSNSDAKTMHCQITQAEWRRESSERYLFRISANRFLRGMVRLIVGMSINVGMRKLRLEKVKEALTNQTRLTKSYSAPPQGLFLNSVVYPPEVVP